MKHHNIISYNPKLKERARQLRQNMTQGEIILGQQLKRKQMMGYDFDRQRPIDQFIVDFYCKALRLAIKIAGSSHDSPDAQVKDQGHQAILEALGIRFLRFHNTDVKQNIDEVRQAIKQWLTKHQE